MDFLDFGYFQHACEPLTDQFEVAEAALVDHVVGDLEEVLEVGDTQLITSHVSTIPQLKLPL